ncbi:remorin [Trifolium pratense]|uniref:Remorin n=1 Tax=Trifolium pratense TaxID=57577 RepID=A0A2K3MN85_TRIPR|nr:remorin [Trifolium pratense]PNX95950.1 remorin [Trifolium pratense]PNY00866.1 remorin [Trifolium pratense]
MGELEGSDLNKTESSLEVVPEEHSPVLVKESDALNTISQEPNDQQVTSIVDDDQKVVEDHADNKETGDHDDKKDTKDSTDRDTGLAKIVAEKRLALIKAWEESEKTKAENRQEAYKKQSAVGLWEESRKASIEAQLKKFEENLERKKVEYVLKMKNEVAEIHQYAEEKRAIVEAQKREEFLDLEDTAAKFRSRGVAPKKFFACFNN